MSIFIRRLKDSDVAQIEVLLHETVHAINAQDYSQEQLDAWAPTLSEAERHERVQRLHVSLVRNDCCVADSDGIVVGFADISVDGYLDHMYVHKNYQRQGIASQLLGFVEDTVRKIGVSTVRTHASITAKSFFEHQGYVVVHPQTVTVRGVSMTNYKMIKVFKA